MGNSSANLTPVRRNPGAEDNIERDAIVKIGYLIKQGEVRKNWNKRYCVLLRNRRLLYFTNANCVEYRGTADFSRVTDVGMKGHSPELFHVQTPARKWEFRAANRDEASDWLRQIRFVCEFNVQGEIGRTATQFRREMSLISGGMMGWLTKKGELRRNWNDRFAVLLPSRLMVYFTDDTCDNFKGTGDFRGHEVQVRFDETKGKGTQFYVDTEVRQWCFRAKTKIVMRQWTSTLQYLIEMDLKTVVFQLKVQNVEWPDVSVVQEHFESVGEVLHLDFYEKPFIAYVVEFEKEETARLVLSRGRRHLVNDPGKEKSVESTTELLAFKFSEYLGGVFDHFDRDGLASMDATETYTSRVHMLSKRIASSRKPRAQSNADGLSEKKESKEQSYSSQFDVERQRSVTVQQTVSSNRDTMRIQPMDSSTLPAVLDDREMDKAQGDDREDYSEAFVGRGVEPQVSAELSLRQQTMGLPSQLSADIASADELISPLSTMEPAFEAQSSIATDREEQKERKKTARFDLDNISIHTVSDDGSDFDPDFTSPMNRRDDKMLRRETIVMELKDAPKLKELVMSDDQIDDQSGKQVENLLEFLEGELGDMQSVARYMAEGGDIKYAYQTFKNQAEDEKGAAEDAEDEKEDDVSVPRQKSKPKKKKSVMFAEPPKDIGNGVASPTATRKRRNTRTQRKRRRTQSNVRSPSHAKAHTDIEGLKFAKGFALFTPEPLELMAKVTSESVNPDDGTEEIRRRSVVQRYRSLDPATPPPGSSSGLGLARPPLRQKTYSAPAIARTFSEEYMSDEDYDEGGTVIIDTGTGTIKAGFARWKTPMVIPNMVATRHKYADYATNLSEEEMHFGDDPLTKHSAQMFGELMFPMKRGKIAEWDVMTMFWENILVQRLDIEEIFTKPLVLMEPPGNPQKMRERTLMHSFEDLDVPRFYLFNSALANFYSTGRTKEDYAIIVDAGHGTTNISCIYLGMYLANYASTLSLAGKDITEYLTQLLAPQSMYFHLDNSFRIVSAMKHRFCYVAGNFLAEQHKATTAQFDEEMYTLPDGRQLKVGKERFEAPELFFAPNDPMHDKGLTSHRALHSSLIQTTNQLDDDDVERDMYRNIIACGGSAALPGFGERLQHELAGSLKRRYTVVPGRQVDEGVKVHVVPDPELSAWKGAKMVTSLDSFEDRWITRNEYHEFGHNIFFRKCNHQDL